MDKNKVITVVLSNQRRFTFSSKCDDIGLNQYIIEARVLYKTIMDLPILPNLASGLEDELIKRSIFGTAAIEGNPLTEKQVVELIEDKDKNDTNPIIRSNQEILNLRIAYDAMVLKSNESIILESDLTTLHRIITNDINYKGNTPGQYRNHQVKVGDTSHGGIYTPPYIGKDIKSLMNKLIEWLNSKNIKELNPIVRAALAHYHFGIIHPFGDGNGRVARALEAYLLKLAKIKYVPVMLSNYYYKNIDEYYWSFSKTLKSNGSDVSVFLEFVLKGFVESLNEIKDRITFFIRKFTLRDYYNFLKEEKQINKRQFELLNILINHDVEFTLNELAVVAPFNLIYRNLSERTINRDIQNLINRKFIIEVSNKKYKINIKAIG